MNTIPVKTLQGYAAQAAKALEAKGYQLTAQPIVAARGAACRFHDFGFHAHCHTNTGKLCFNAAYLARMRESGGVAYTKELKRLCEHEVAHLAVYRHGKKFVAACKDAIPRHAHRWQAALSPTSKGIEGDQYVIRYPLFCTICGRKKK